MNGFQLVTHARNSSFRSGFFRALGVLSAFGALLLLGACGKTTRSLSADATNETGLAAKDGAAPSGGQPSAKFAFSTSSLTLIDETTGTSDWVTILSSPLKTPAAKEVYVSASLEAGLYTQTLVKSKLNKKDTSTASVAIQVRALIDGTPMPPGVVTYAARTQTVVLDPNCVTPEEIELILNTLNAASFNFVASDVPVGTHMISLQARISSSTSAQTGTASAKALVGKGTMVGQILRAVK